MLHLYVLFFADNLRKYLYIKKQIAISSKKMYNKVNLMEGLMDTSENIELNETIDEEKIAHSHPKNRPSKITRELKKAEEEEHSSSKKPTEDPEDPDDEDPIGETVDDDDDDDETDSDDDDGEEDENELKQLEQQKQRETQPLITLDPLSKLTNEEAKKALKEKPKGPTKIDRSPFQQFLDFFMHGVKGAQIKNGEISKKPRIIDQILLGLGFKSFKRDILIHEQANKYWNRIALGLRKDKSLLNTDKVDKKIRREERLEKMPIQKALTEQKKRQQEEHIVQTMYLQRNAETLQRNLADRIIEQRRTENIRQQLAALQEKETTNATQLKEHATRVAQNELTQTNSAQKKETAKEAEIITTAGTTNKETGEKSIQKQVIEAIEKKAIETRKQEQSVLRQSDDVMHLQQMQQQIMQQSAQAQTISMQMQQNLSAVATLRAHTHPPKPPRLVENTDASDRTAHELGRTIASNPNATIELVNTVNKQGGDSDVTQKVLDNAYRLKEKQETNNTPVGRSGGGTIVPDAPTDNDNSQLRGQQQGRN